MRCILFPTPPTSKQARERRQSLLWSNNLSFSCKTGCTAYRDFENCDSATVHQFLESNIPSAALGSLSHARNKLSRDICWETAGPFFSQTGLTATLMTSTAHESHKENCPPTPQFLWCNVYHVHSKPAHLRYKFQPTAAGIRYIFLLIKLWLKESY